MSIHFFEGFDRYANNGSDISLGQNIASMHSQSIILEEGRFGGNCISVNGGGLVFNARNLSQLFFGTALKPLDIAAQTDTNFLSFSPQIYLRLGTGGNVQLYRGTALVGSSDDLTLTQGVWQYLAVDLYIHDTSGYCKIYVNGHLILNYSGDTKISNTEARVESIGLTSGDTSLSRISMYYDDVYLADNTGTINNTIILDCRVQTLLPTADTAQKDFTPLSGSDNYAMVDDETPDGDTTYVYTATDGHKDLYEVENLDENSKTVYAVSSFAVAKKTDVDYVSLNCIVDSGGTESSPAGTGLGLDYILCEEVIETDPATSSAWTPAAVNGLKVGFETDYF
jgi:hypothetical protein